jgi:hypothetical protein
MVGSPAARQVVLAQTWRDVRIEPCRHGTRHVLLPANANANATAYCLAFARAKKENADAGQVGQAIGRLFDRGGK